MLRRILRTTAIALLVLVVPTAFADGDSLDTLADHLAEQLRTQRKKFFFPKVIVADFPLLPGRVNALSENIADQLSALMAQRLGATAMIERKALHDRLQADLLSPNDLRDRGVANWLLGEIGANAVISGHIAVSADTLKLSVELRRIADDKRLADAVVVLPLTEEWKALSTKPMDWFFPPGLAVPCSTMTVETAASFKEKGMTQPTCPKCRLPEYTDAARAAKAQGNVKMSVIVDETGRATTIRVVKGAPYGLIEQSVEAVRSWKFKPAMKDDKPVTTCVVIETTFRLF
jgi:TonB family protein